VSPAKLTVIAFDSCPGGRPARLTLGSVAWPLLPVVAVPTTRPFSEKTTALFASGAFVAASVRVAVRFVVPPAKAMAGLTARFARSTAIWNWRIWR